MSDSLQLHGLQHTRPLCPSPTPGVHSNSYPLSQWCHPTISSSVVPLSACLQSFPVSGSFLMSQFFTLCGQSIGASASVLPVNIQDWFPLGLTGLASLPFFDPTPSFFLVIESNLDSKVKAVLSSHCCTFVYGPLLLWLPRKGVDPLFPIQLLLQRIDIFS